VVSAFPRLFLVLTVSRYLPQFVFSCSPTCLIPCFPRISTFYRDNQRSGGMATFRQCLAPRDSFFSLGLFFNTFKNFPPLEFAPSTFSRRAVPLLSVSASLANPAPSFTSVGSSPVSPPPTSFCLIPAPWECVYGHFFQMFSPRYFPFPLAFSLPPSNPIVHDSVLPSLFGPVFSCFHFPSCSSSFTSKSFWLTLRECTLIRFDGGPSPRKNPLLSVLIPSWVERFRDPDFVILGRSCLVTIFTPR